MTGTNPFLTVWTDSDTDVTDDPWEVDHGLHERACAEQRRPSASVATYGLDTSEYLLPASRLALSNRSPRRARHRDVSFPALYRLDRIHCAFGSNC